MTFLLGISEAEAGVGGGEVTFGYKTSSCRSGGLTGVLF